MLVSYEAIRYGCQKFGPSCSRTLGRKQGRLGDIWHVDELFITIRGQRLYLGRAVDQDGDMIDILVTQPRDHRAAKRFFHWALKHQGQAPWQLITDRLRSYPAAHRDIFPSLVHRTGQYENNRAEVSLSTLVNKSGKCEASNQWHRLSVFSRFTVPSRTCLESVGIILRPLIIDSCQPGLFPIGER